MGKPEAVWLAYSREKDTIAIENAGNRGPKTFPVKECQNGWRIMAGPFLGHFGIRTKQTLGFPNIDDTGGILLLDLRTTVNVTPRRYEPRK